MFLEILVEVPDIKLMLSLWEDPARSESKNSMKSDTNYLLALLCYTMFCDIPIHIILEKIIINTLYIVFSV
jgi:hypothetical protein